MSEKLIWYNLENFIYQNLFSNKINPKYGKLKKN